MSRHSRQPSDFGRALLGIILVFIGFMALFGGGFPSLIVLVGLMLVIGALINQGDWSVLPRNFQREATRLAEDFGEWIQDFEEEHDEGERRQASRARERRERLREWDRDRDRSRGEVRRSTASQQSVSGRKGNAIHAVAAKAVQAAGHEPGDLAVVPVDVGVLAYGEEDTPTLYRESKLPDEANYVRPFVILRCPRRARGKIRFELIDGQGTRRFIDETPWELKEGETFVYPETWLPTHRIEDYSGDWSLRVYAAGMLLAQHVFEWRDMGGGEFRGLLDGDGEINQELAREINKARLERVSLDDLLEDQDGVIEFDPEVEAAARRAEQLNREYNRRAR